MEPIRNLFAALFLASIGMLIHVQFLWTHVDILLASVILVIVFKTTVATVITKVFGYNIRTSLIVSHPSKHLLDKIYCLNFLRVWMTLQVGLLLAQIGEFAFVLLSRASNLHIVQVISSYLSYFTCDVSYRFGHFPFIIPFRRQKVFVFKAWHWSPDALPFNVLSSWNKGIALAFVEIDCECHYFCCFKVYAWHNLNLYIVSRLKVT